MAVWFLTLAGNVGGMVSWGLETLNLITNDSKRDTLRN